MYCEAVDAVNRSQQLMRPLTRSATRCCLQQPGCPSLHTGAVAGNLGRQRADLSNSCLPGNCLDGGVVSILLRSRLWAVTAAGRRAACTVSKPKSRQPFRDPVHQHLLPRHRTGRRTVTGLLRNCKDEHEETTFLAAASPPGRNTGRQGCKGSAAVPRGAGCDLQWSARTPQRPTTTSR